MRTRPVPAQSEGRVGAGRSGARLPGGSARAREGAGAGAAGVHPAQHGREAVCGGVLFFFICLPIGVDRRGRRVYIRASLGKGPGANLEAIMSLSSLYEALVFHHYQVVAVKGVRCAGGLGREEFLRRLGGLVRVGRSFEVRVLIPDGEGVGVEESLWYSGGNLVAKRGSALHSLLAGLVPAVR